MASVGEDNEIPTLNQEILIAPATAGSKRQNERDQQEDPPSIQPIRRDQQEDPPSNQPIRRDQQEDPSPIQPIRRDQQEDPPSPLPNHGELEDSDYDPIDLLASPENQRTVGGNLGNTEETRQTTPSTRYNLRRGNERARLGEYARKVTGDTTKPPLNLKQAKERADWPLWKAAIETELQSHADNGTWSLTQNPDDRSINIVSCKWVFVIKKKADGSLDKYKARLVARGFTQRYGYDYDETFSPVVKATTLRVLIGLAAAFSWKIVHWDAVTAFLNGKLQVEVYMKMPPGYETPGKVCLLRKAIYGLKQAGREWYIFATKVLISIGFTKLEEDHCLFTLKNPGRRIILALYVDDIVATSENQEALEWLQGEIKKNFKITDQGPLSSVLNVDVLRTPTGISLGQPGYINKILERFQMDSGKTAFTPLPTSGIAHPEDPSYCSEEDKELFQQLVGSVNYLACYTRPDIAFAVHALSRHLANPTVHALSAAKTLLRYLKTTKDYRLSFPKLTSGRKLTLRVYTDADFANQKATYHPKTRFSLQNQVLMPENREDRENTPRKSVTGMIFLLNGAPISWLSKQQPIIATSTQMAEYIAAAEGGKEALWLRSLLKSLQLWDNTGVPLHIDNQAAIQLCKNPVLHKATKHIDIIYHKIRELAADGIITIEFTESSSQKADALTKPLSRQRTEEFCRGIQMVGQKTPEDLE